MTRYYVHIPLPQKFRDVVMAIRNKYGYESKSDPHITLIAPSKIIVPRSEDELIVALVSAAKKLSQFPVVEKDMYYFDDKEIICARIEANGGLGLCRRALLPASSGILEPPSGPFADMPNPHVTILENISAKDRDSIWSEVRDRVIFSQFTCDKISLLRKGEFDSCWQTVAGITVGS